MAVNFEANFFTLMELLDPAGRQDIDSMCTKTSFPPNEVIYEQGSPSTAVYIIVSGLVEAYTVSKDGRQTRSIGMMGKGDFFGDLGVLIGQTRLASVRTCEPTKVLQIEKLAFIKLLERVPKLGAFFSRNLARRLYQTSTEAYVKIFQHDLTGNLQHFDLLTIFQAITSTGRNGELHLNNSSNEIIGSFFFRKGRAVNARFLHLAGEEAVWQGFMQLTTDGTFVFRVADEPAGQFTDDTKLEMEAMALLMEGAQRRDSFYSLPESLRLMQGRLSRLTPELAWSDEAIQPVAERIWELIAKRPQPLDSLWRRLNYSSYTFLGAVGELLNTGQAELQAESPPAEPTVAETSPFAPENPPTVGSP